MRLIGLAVVLTVSLNLAQIAAEAQQAARIPRIGFLSASSPSSEEPRLAAFREGLRKV